MRTKINLAITCLVAITLTFGACGSQEKKDPATEQNSTSQKALYTCSMHPEVRSDRPGKCPKCGMELIKVEKASDTAVTK